jgi:maltooligosyltrehalose trehalohydrolase
VAEKQEALNSFGAEITPQGVRFRLWAPAARSVDLFLDEKSLFEMPKRPDGWFERIVPEARAGTLYRYRIDGIELVPDPASRFQPQDVAGPSEVIDPAFAWKEWPGRPWREAVIYELHVGAFTPEGTYRGVIGKLNFLRENGITALELMPLSDFPGRRNWGYDGVLPYAPDSAYGRPEDLRALVQAAHDAGLMIFLDVVYNHFGPEGNWLHRYAPRFFTERHATPWGAAINFTERAVRDYFVANALYWLGEYRFDGLRFDAVHAIFDDSPTHVLDELANVVRGKFAHLRHLVLENDANQARFISRGRYDAQWNDDAHHAFHVLATGEKQGYYVAYQKSPAQQLARCLAEGFAYQGELSPFTGEKRGEPSRGLPASCFVDFLQNHDQIGNRAKGERLLVLAQEHKVRALTAIQLLAPSPPLIFMGEEWGCRQPFLFFCDFDGELAESVKEGRRAEFPHAGEFIDPLAESTFAASTLDWSKADPAWLAHYRELLQLRQKEIVPLDCGPGRYRMLGERAFDVEWVGLRLIANCGDDALAVEAPAAKALWSNGKPGAPWTVNWWKSR